MSLAAEESTMCFTYVYISRRLSSTKSVVGQWNSFASLLARVPRFAAVGPVKIKKKGEEEEKRNYTPCKDILEPWPNICWFIRRLLSRRRRTRSQGDPLNALLSQDVTQGHKSDVFWIACSEMLRTKYKEGNMLSISFAMKPDT